MEDEWDGLMHGLLSSIWSLVASVSAAQPQPSTNVKRPGLNCSRSRRTNCEGSAEGYVYATSNDGMDINKT